MTVSDFLADTRNLLARIDRGQTRMIVGYLRRLRERKGNLYLIGTPCSLPLRDTGLTFGNGDAPATSDVILCFAPHWSPNLPTDPLHLAIVGATDGHIAQNVSACVVIPTFDPSLLIVGQAAIWTGIVRDLSR